jgi:hypothetical protein
MRTYHDLHSKYLIDGLNGKQECESGPIWEAGSKGMGEDIRKGIGGEYDGNIIHS